MAQGSNNNNFLTIPSQEGLFRTVRVERSEAENSDCPFDDEDEEETEEDVRLIPRCSPVPRKRGPSIADETAEYMRIRLALPNRRVSFADTTGRELVDVRMFVAFDSDEEDDSRWEEEVERYRKAYREPTYRVWPEFQTLSGTELVLSVHTNKLEVESVTAVPDDPLSFHVLIRVLNISFHKSVYVRSTMDGWITHFDYPAEYVDGSSDGETDHFSVKLSFASPYLFNGARIDFVARYETSNEEFWANNSGRNYSVTLIQSYEEDTTQSTSEESIELRGILKPPRYRTNADYDESYDKGDDLRNNEFESAENETSFAQPVVVQPEIDIETAKNLSSSPQSVSTAGCLYPTTDSLYREPLPLESTSSNNSPQTEELETTDTTIQSSTSHEPQSQSTSQFSEPQVHVCNVVASVPLPTVCVHLCDDYYEFEDFNKPDHELQHEIAAQVPFEFGQHSSGGFSNAPRIQGEDDFKEKMDDTEVDVLEGQCQNIAEKIESCFHMLEKSVQPPFSKEVDNDHATEDVEKLKMGVDSLTEGLQHSLEKKTQEHEVELGIIRKAETTKVVDVMWTMESTRKDDDGMDESVSSSLSPCPAVKTCDRDLTTLQEKRLVLEPGEDPTYNNQTCMSTELSTELHELARVSETLSTVPYFVFDLQPQTVHSSTEEDLSYQGVEHSAASYQTHKDSETKLPLPTESCKISTISKNEKEVSLEKCVIVSITFFSAAVCLAVGIQEPSIFLVMGLFLLSLCF